MSLEKLENNINNLEDKVAQSEFDISDSFMEDKEIYKNIIRIENPTITEQELDVMFDGIDIPELEGVYPISENKYKQKVEELKTEVRNAVSQLYKEFKSLASLLATSTVSTVSSIPALTITVTAPPWNIPDAITKCSMLIDLFLKIVDKIKTSVSLISPIKKLKFLIDPDNIQPITGPINLIIKAILALFSPITILSDFIKQLLNFIKSIFGGKNEKTSIERVTKRLRKLNYLSSIRDEDIDKVDEDDRSEVEQILENYKVVRPRSKDNAVELKDKDKFNDQVKNLQNSIEKTNQFLKNNQPNQSQDLDNFVFDVKLPDGTILEGLTQEEKNEIDKLYELQFVSQSSFDNL